MQRLATLLVLLALTGLVLNCSPSRRGSSRSSGDDDDDDSAGDDDDVTGDDDDATGDDDDATGDDDDSTSGYDCGWPTWSGADSLGNTGFTGSIDIGERFPRVVATDECGEEVDLYHLAGGPPVIIAMQAMWSAPDRTLSDWLGGGDGSSLQLDPYDAVRDAVQSGDLRWVSYLIQNEAGSPPTGDDIDSWTEMFPTPGVPVMAGEDVEFLMDWAGLTFIPNLTLVDANMNVLAFTEETWVTPLDVALEQL
jgi:hypothetical protein